MIERNYRTWCAQNDVLVEDGPVEETGMDDANDANDADDGMEIDGDDNEEVEDVPSFFGSEPKEIKKKSKGKIGDLMRTKVKKVLDDTGLAQQRAGKCDEADFLKYVIPIPR